MDRSPIPLALLLAAAPAAAQGQAAAIGDTVFYREETVSETVLRMPSGEIPLSSTHDAVIGWVRVAPDSARAWYEILFLETASPNGNLRPETEGALGQAFVLTLGPAGAVRTLAAPRFPEEVRRVTDLSLQFSDFFLPAPPEPLREGLTWTDTVRVERPGPSGGSWQTTKVALYRVVGDSLAGKTPVFVVRSRVTQDMRSEVPVEGQPGVVAIKRTAGTEDGLFLVAKKELALLAREREARLEGTLEYVGLSREVSFPVVDTYRSSIGRVSRPVR